MKIFILISILLLNIQSSFAKFDEDENKIPNITRVDLDSVLVKTLQILKLEYKNDPDFLSDLERSQQAWIVYRDVTLELMHPKRMQESYGKYQFYGLNNYYMKLTEARITQLNEWLDGYPEGVIGIGTVKYHYELNSLPVEKYEKQYSNDDMMELGWELIAKEMLGPLKLGMSNQELSKVLQLPYTTDPMYFCAVDGLDHQTWYYDKIGVQVEMDGKELCEQVIGAVHIKSPSTWTTNRRIRIGSTRAEVIKAYKRSIEIHSDLTASDLIAGSAYGGIQFIFENDLVKEIFIGILNHD